MEKLFFRSHLCRHKNNQLARIHSDCNFTLYVILLNNSVAVKVLPLHEKSLNFENNLLFELAFVRFIFGINFLFKSVLDIER